MYKDFVNVTPESGGAGTTPIAVAADENEGAARSTSLNIAGGGVTRTVSITLYHSKENACGKPN